MAYIRGLAKNISLLDHVRFTGFVSDEGMPYLYKQPIVLVMSTYFGSTNLSPIEAFKLRVPVLYPDLPGLRYEVANASLLMDL